MTVRRELLTTTGLSAALFGALAGLSMAAAMVEGEGAPGASPQALLVAQATPGGGAGETERQIVTEPAGEAAAAAAPATAAIEPPSDPLAKAAFDVLDKHCARCHQVGRLNRQKPSKNFGNVLALDEIARDPNLILPGNPDGSRLFIQMAKQEMPYDVFQEYSGGDEPTEEELKQVYDWIRSLDAVQVAACTDRQPISSEAIVAAIAEDLDAQPEHRRKGMRYITLSHFHNACASDDDMIRFRQGAVKLLNSLSRESDVLRMRTIDEAKTIIAFHLDDLKWEAADWDRIVAAYPYKVRPDTTRYETVKQITATPLAWVRGDWFAFTASRPPLYYDLLKLPKTFGELQKQLDLDVDGNIEKLIAKRAGFQISGVSKHNRLIERHSISTGYFWTSYDFGGDRPEQSLFVRPLGPKGENAFEADGGETIFSLPNGFQAYYLNTEKGERLDKGPTEIVLDDSQRDRTVTNAISCFGCHNQGIRKATDEVRKHVLSDRTFPRDVREKVAALYPPVEEMSRLLDEDYNRFIGAMRRAGLDPELDSQKAGVESINHLSKQYEKAVDLRLAAAEYGIPQEQLADGLSAAGGEAFRTKRRLEQGLLPRETFESRFVTFAAHVSDDVPVEIAPAAVAAAPAVATVGGKTKEETHDFDLTLISDKSAYKINDLAVFTVVSKADCHLTLINVDSNGTGTVIFPNKFQQDNFLPAGKEVQFPGSDAGFQFRLKDPGTETVIAVCNSGGKTADGIQHDFKTRSFTPLGNYRSFVTRQIAVEAKEKVATATKAKTAGKAAGDTAIIARTAIKFEVK